MVRIFTKKLYGKFNIWLFGNKIGIYSNFIHLLYDAVYNFLYKRKASSSLSKSVNTNGFIVIESFFSDEEMIAIHDEINSIYKNKNEKFYCSDLENRGLLRIKSPYTNLAGTKKLIEDSKYIKLINSYFGGPSFTYRTDVYRTFKPASQEFYDSVLWHFDNAPSSLLKVMIYLTDVTKNNGAINLVNKRISSKLKKKGFWDRFSNEKFSSKIEDNKVEVEGRRGTVIIFTPQNCIHRATIPQVDYRDVLVTTYYPSLSKEKHTDFSIEHYAGYLLNPFTRQPLRIDKY